MIVTFTYLDHKRRIDLRIIFMGSSKALILLIKLNIIKISIGFSPEANVIVQDLIQHIQRIIFFMS